MTRIKFPVDFFEFFSYQVAETLRGEGVLERELRPLRDLRDNYPKTVVTLDPMPPSSEDGIRCVNAEDFLLRRA